MCRDRGSTAEDPPQLAKPFTAKRSRNETMHDAVHTCSTATFVSKFWRRHGAKPVRQTPRVRALALDQERNSHRPGRSVDSGGRDEAIPRRKFMQWFLQNRSRPDGNPGAGLPSPNKSARASKSVDVKRCGAAASGLHAAGGRLLDPGGDQRGSVRPPVFQPGLGAAAVSTNQATLDLWQSRCPRNVPAVHRPALSRRAVNEL